MAAVATDKGDYRLEEVKEFDESKIGVKGLSDSGITSIPRIFIHPPETLSTLKSSSSSAVAGGLPVVDLSDVDSANHRLAIVGQIREAASEWGFFQLINHGVPLSVLDETIAAIKSFHEQPQDLKAMHYRRDERGAVCYTSNYDLYRSQAATWHDYLQVWMSPEPPQLHQIPAICRDEAVAWNQHATGVAETIAELLSEGLGLESRKLKDLTLLETRVFVGICYPYCPQPDLTVGLSQHTDGGVLTVLLQNQVPGLQVKHGDQWVDVRPLPGALIINIADFLQVISNGKYKSVQHRVVANSRKEPRISIVELFSVGSSNGPDHLYGPLPELLSAEKPALYRTFTKQEFEEHFYSKELDSRSVIEMVKL